MFIAEAACFVVCLQYRYYSYCISIFYFSFCIEFIFDFRFACAVVVDMFKHLAKWCRRWLWDSKWKLWKHTECCYVFFVPRFRKVVRYFFVTVVSCAL